MAVRATKDIAHLPIIPGTVTVHQSHGFQEADRTVAAAPTTTQQDTLTVDGRKIVLQVTMMSPGDIVLAIREGGVPDVTLDRFGQLFFPSSTTVTGTNSLLSHLGLA